MLGSRGSLFIAKMADLHGQQNACVSVFAVGFECKRTMVAQSNGY